MLALARAFADPPRMSFAGREASRDGHEVERAKRFLYDLFRTPAARLGHRVHTVLPHFRKGDLHLLTVVARMRSRRSWCCVLARRRFLALAQGMLERDQLTRHEQV